MIKTFANKFLFITLFAVTFQATARKVGVDFAPIQSWDSVTNAEVPLSENGIAVGWYLKGVANIDYKKIQTDEVYARQVLDNNGDAFETKVRNLVYDVNTGVALSDVPLTKDKDGTENTFAVCFDGASFGSNHRSCSLNVDTGTGYTLVQVDGKWDTASVQAIKFEGKKAVAWGDLNNKASEVFGAYLVKKYGNDPKFKEATDNGANVDNLAFNFNAKKILPFVVNGVTNLNIALVKGTASADVPKGDENTFSATVNGTMKLVREGEKISLEKVAPSADKK